MLNNTVDLVQSSSNYCMGAIMTACPCAVVTGACGAYVRQVFFHDSIDPHVFARTPSAMASFPSGALLLMLLLLLHTDSLSAICETDSFFMID